MHTVLKAGYMPVLDTFTRFSVLAVDARRPLQQCLSEPREQKVPFLIECSRSICLELLVTVC